MTMTLNLMLPHKQTPLDAIRLRNALVLFDEFALVAAAAGASNVQSLNAAFAERVKIAPSQWSRFKSRRDHIGAKLARQIAVHMGKPPGWLDQEHSRHGPPVPSEPGGQPANEQERLAVALFLAAFRSNPESVSKSLLGVLADELGKSDKPQQNA